MTILKLTMCTRHFTPCLNEKYDNLKVFDDNQQWGPHRIVEKLVKLTI